MGNIYFNPRSSCEERLAPVNNGAQTVLFQSTLLMRGATRLHHLRLRRRYFNPRSSCEERRAAVTPTCITARISIHAPHARSDDRCLPSAASITNFNPRSSCEERRMAAYIQQACKEFQSTLLMRGATPPACAANPHQHISIHAPHARSDVQDRHRQILFRISIHAPHARSDLEPHHRVALIGISIHAPHARSDPD